MTTQLRYFIGGVVGLVAGVMLTAFLGSSDLFARDAAIQPPGALEMPQVEARSAAIRSTAVSPRTVARRTVAPQARTTATSVAPKRSWKKSALVIGGSAAAGAGIGGIADGKKGALIGAAIGGGAGAIFEAIKRKD